MPLSQRKYRFASRSESNVAPEELYHARHWYACRTRARAEKQTGRLLASRGIEAYLPLVQEVRQWADRKKRVEFPLFPGYVLARFDLRNVHEVLQTPGLVTIVRNNGYPSPLADEEVESVRILVAGVNAGDGTLKPWDYLEVGQEVIVAEGPFSGMRGVLVEQRRQARVAVGFSALGQAVTIELPREILRAA